MNNDSHNIVQRNYEHSQFQNTEKFRLYRNIMKVTKVYVFEMWSEYGAISFEICRVCYIVSN